MRRSALVLLSLFVGVSGGFAQEGTTTAQTLRRNVNARPAGMGEAYAGVNGDIDTFYFNPGGGSQIAYPTLVSTYQHGFAEDNFGSLGYAQPMPFGSLFVGGAYYDAGTIELNQSSGFQGEVHAQQDVVGMVGLALGKNLPIGVGVTGKFLRSELAEAATASGYAFDAGVHWSTPLKGLGFGAAIQNVGPDLTYENEGDPLPETVRVGVGYELDLEKYKQMESFPYTVAILVDGVKVKDESSGVHAGLELGRRLTLSTTEGWAALRGGYRSDAKSFDVGAGFTLAQFTLDYSLRMISDLDMGHRVTLSYRFKPRTPEKKFDRKIGSF